jgi:hypothetical protein
MRLYNSNNRKRTIIQYHYSDKIVFPDNNHQSNPLNPVFRTIFNAIFTNLKNNHADSVIQIDYI